MMVLRSIAKSWALIAVFAAVAVPGSPQAQTFNLDKKKQELSGGPQPKSTLPSTAHLPKFDVIVPVFDPNIPKKDKDDVWPEVRRVEANRFAVLTKRALQATGAFGAVRVTPDDSGFGELYVHGTILKANTEDVKVKIEVNDIRGRSTRREWLSKTFSYRVPAQFHQSVRKQGGDAYAPLFDAIAAEIVKKLARKKAKKVKDLKAITEMRFANMFGPEYFGQYLKSCKRKCKLKSLPATNDPLYQKIQTMRIREQLFVDGFQQPYDGFYADADSAYLDWQKYGYPIAVERRKERARGATRLLLGAAAVAGAIATDNPNVAVVGGVAGVVLFADAINKYRSAGASGETLDQMGQSVNLDLSPQVVQFENVSTQLQGDAVDQFITYRGHLQKIYEKEQTPTTDLLALE
ncbi:MAG: hypothetical protein AAF862_12255 [Pseudomonadota bacterium]